MMSQAIDRKEKTMQFPEFDHKAANYDAFKVMTNRHIGVYRQPAHLITTVHNEAFWMGSKVEPNDRRTYSQFNFKVVSTTDSDCPEFAEPDGTPVRKAWLQHKGQQVLLIDYDSGVVVRLDYERHHSDLPECVPQWVRSVGACCYWPGPGVRPYGRPVKIGQPYKPCMEEEELVKARKAQAEMWFALTYEERGREMFVSHTQVNFLTVAQTPFEKMTTQTRIFLARNPVARAIMPRYVDHLVLKA